MLTYPAILRPEIGLQRISLYEGGQDFIKHLANVQGIFGNAFEVFYRKLVREGSWFGDCGDIKYRYCKWVSLKSITIDKPGLMINPPSTTTYYVPEEIDYTGSLLYIIPICGGKYPPCRLHRLRSDDSFMQQDLLCLDTMGNTLGDELIGPLVLGMNEDANKLKEVLLTSH